MIDCTDIDDECFSNYIDCTGECDGDAQVLTYCYDSDQDGFGQPGTETDFCNEFVENNWVLDCTDLNDEIFVKAISLMNALFVMVIIVNVINQLLMIKMLKLMRMNL